MGWSAAALSTTKLVACKPSSVRALNKLKALPSGISQDELVLAEGFDYYVLISHGDAINDFELFGSNNDFIAVQSKGRESLLMWVNHEYPDPLLIHGNNTQDKTQDQVDQEMQAVGGSLIHVAKQDGVWNFVPNHPSNHRLNAKTDIPINAARPIQGAEVAVGTHSNCAGGMTPWGTFLTCEENYQDMVGDRVSYENRNIQESSYDYGWRKFYNYPPEHYGWVVEVDPKTNTFEKITSMGRFSHEGATVVKLDDDRVVVYMGDDKQDECIYKFISSKPNTLTEGTLYVANTEEGRWVPLDHATQPLLKDHFKDKTDVLVWARRAAKMMGGTPQHRPEDIAINPINKDVLVALTNHSGNNDPFGQLLKITETNQDPASLTFTAKTFQAGGPETGFACPDNLAFDRNGNLWMTTDISGSKMNQSPYTFHGNNGLFVIPMQGDRAGQAIQVASAPMDAELTGPCFAPDGKTLFVSVQHPGERSKSLDQLTSHWPHGGEELPQSSVVAITGPTLEKIIS